MIWRLSSLYISQTFLSLLIKLGKSFNYFRAKTYSNSRQPFCSHTLWQQISLDWWTPLCLLRHSSKCCCFYSSPAVNSQFSIQSVLPRLLIPRTIFHACTCSRATCPKMPVPRSLYLLTKNRTQWIKMFLVFSTGLFPESLQNQWASLFSQ